MAKFIVRVELIQPDGDSYGILHRAMERKGFTRTIPANSGKLFDLPEGEYRMATTKTDTEVFALANEAASETKKNSYILVTPTDGCTYRLKEHKEAAGEAQK